MFYKTGIDITNDKQMFKFLKGHFEYPTMNSWNCLYSIANKVKIYDLKLSGNPWTALALLQNGEYDTISWMIQDWERNHSGYEVYFNGRSGGYLVLKSTDYNGNLLPESILDSNDYDDYKEWCRENYGTVRENRDELVYFTNLVRDFDKLCDEIRAYCDDLSKMQLEVVEMERTVALFNNKYENDLELLGFNQLVCDSEGKVDISEIRTLECLYEAFLRLAERDNCTFNVDSDKAYYKM